MFLMGGLLEVAQQLSARVQQRFALLRVIGMVVRLQKRMKGYPRLGRAI
jgi:hypothetical protein